MNLFIYKFLIEISSIKYLLETHLARILYMKLLEQYSIILNKSLLQCDRKKTLRDMGQHRFNFQGYRMLARSPINSLRSQSGFRDRKNVVRGEKRQGKNELSKTPRQSRTAITGATSTDSTSFVDLRESIRLSPLCKRSANKAFEQSQHGNITRIYTMLIYRGLIVCFRIEDSI